MQRCASAKRKTALVKIVAPLSLNNIPEELGYNLMKSIGILINGLSNILKINIGLIKKKTRLYSVLFQHRYSYETNVTTFGDKIVYYLLRFTYLQSTTRILTYLLRVTYL